MLSVTSVPQVSAAVSSAPQGPLDIDIEIAPQIADESASVGQPIGQPAAEAQNQVPSVSWSAASNVAFQQGLKDAASVLGSSGVSMCVQAAARAAIAAAGVGPVATLAVAGIAVLAINGLATQHMAHSFVPTNTARAIGAAVGMGIVASAIGPALANGATKEAAEAAVRMLGTSIYSGLRDVLQGAIKPELPDLVKAPNLAMLPENGTSVTSGPASAYGRVAAATAFYGAMQMGAAGLASYVFPQVSHPALKDFCTAATRTVVEGFDTAAGVLLKRAMHPNDVRIEGPTAQHPERETWPQYFGSVVNNVRGNNWDSVSRNSSFRVALNSLGPMLTSLVPSLDPGVVTGNPYVTNAWTAVTEVRGQLVNWAHQIQTARETASRMGVLPPLPPDPEIAASDESASNVADAASAPLGPREQVVEMANLPPMIIDSSDNHQTHAQSTELTHDI